MTAATGAGQDALGLIALAVVAVLVLGLAARMERDQMDDMQIIELESSRLT